MKKSAHIKNYEISQKYQRELEKIREEVKKGHCSTFKECLALFEDLWREKHPENILFSNKVRRKFEKLSREDPNQYFNVVKKINQIQKKPEHYKPLRGELDGARRVHIGDFVLIYQLERKNIIFQDYDHHDNIYG